jgi:hypothetical protein
MGCGGNVVSVATNFNLSIRQDEIELRVQLCFKDGQGVCGQLIGRVRKLEIL